ncbi:hypothetical protein RRF57_006184 [Xylaria bambusicola]|uniref:SprT-like domain-containing protein n=1 Tax=Xylaria bambusicola TaxID=326684 RepID=A0AAN7UZ11_9PEZI
MKQIKSWPVMLSLEKGTQRLSKAMVLWLRKKPKRPRKGRHPAWPGYTGAGTKLKFELEFKAYLSQCLVENTVLSSYPMPDDRNLTPIQLAARAKIISMWSTVKDRKEHLNTLELNKFTRLFDEFFFFGIMTKNGLLPRLKAKMWEMTPKNLTKHRMKYKKGGDTRISWGFTYERYLRGLGPFANIQITGASFYEKDSNEVNAHFFLETLIHEMVHAYIHLYLCNCAECFKDLPNTAGVAGHGKTFVLLLSCIDWTLRSWGVGLSGLILTMIKDPDHPGTAPPQCLNEVRGLYYRELAHCKMLKDLAAKKANDEENDEENDEANDETSITPVPSSPPSPTPQSTEGAVPPERTEPMLMENLSNLVFKDFQFNELREFTERDPGASVYITSITDVQGGVTRVDLEKLVETGDLVQEMIARQNTLGNMKAWMKRNLDWGKLRNKASHFHWLRKSGEESEAEPNNVDNTDEVNNTGEAGEADGTDEANNIGKANSIPKAKAKPTTRTRPKHEESLVLCIPVPPPIHHLPTLVEEEFI